MVKLDLYIVFIKHQSGKCDLLIMQMWTFYSSVCENTPFSIPMLMYLKAKCKHVINLSNIYIKFYLK